MRKPMCLALALSVSLALGAAQDFSGPFRGNDGYIPYRLFLHNAGLTARANEPDSLELSAQLTYVNDCVAQSQYILLSDYESAQLGLLCLYQLSANWATGAALRAGSVYGGFLDGTIEAFHSVFGFPNGGREYFDRNRVAIALDNDNGLFLYEQRAVFGLEDAEFWLRHTFERFHPDFDTAALLSLKLPLGFQYISSMLSTGYVDVGFGLALDWRSAARWAWYAQAGLYVPGQTFDPELVRKPLSFVSGLLAGEFKARSDLSLLLQLNLKSPVMSTGVMHWYFDSIDRSLFWQTNLMFGAAWSRRGQRLHLGVEEDFLTNHGADISFFFEYTFEL